MSEAITVFLVLATAGHAFLLMVRPGRPAFAAFGYASLALVPLALVCAAAAWHGAETERAERRARDRDFVGLMHAIDAARDTACNSQPPKATDATLLAAYTRTRTTCAYYMMVWIEAGRASDLPGVLAAAKKPWPSAGSPKQQLWSYAPLDAEISKIDAALHRPAASKTRLETRLADAFPFVLAILFAVSLTTLTTSLLPALPRSLNAPPPAPPSSTASAAKAPRRG